MHYIDGKYITFSGMHITLEGILKMNIKSYTLYFDIFEIDFKVETVEKFLKGSYKRDININIFLVNLELR